MGIKERERRVEVFLYGLFTDEELLRGEGQAIDKIGSAHLAFTYFKSAIDGK